MTNMIDDPELKGSLTDGWTEEDVAFTARTLRRYIGWDFVVVWAFNDMWGAGGDSQAYLRAATGELYELPGCLWGFLCEDETLNRNQLELEISELALADVQPAQLVEIDRYNYCFTDHGPDTEAPKF